jgi:hypothetical protein
MVLVHPWMIAMPKKIIELTFISTIGRMREILNLSFGLKCFFSTMTITDNAKVLTSLKIFEHQSTYHTQQNEKLRKHYIT